MLGKGNGNSKNKTSSNHPSRSGNGSKGLHDHKKMERHEAGVHDHGHILHAHVKAIPIQRKEV